MAIFMDYHISVFGIIRSPVAKSDIPSGTEERVINRCVMGVCRQWSIDNVIETE
jgi:hypothetical protein